MSIIVTDEIEAATKKGKMGSARQIFLDGDQENLQQIGEKTHQLENAIKDISASGGASTASAVSYDNEASGMTAVTAQGAIDELAAKDKSQDTEIAKKANTSDVNSQMHTELDKKFDKENVVQELGDSEDKVVSQYALPFRVEENPEWAYLIKDSDDHVLLGIQQDGSVEWGAGIPSPVKSKIQEVIDREASDKEELDTKTDSIKTELSTLIDTLNNSFSEEIQNLKDTKVDKEEGKSLIEDEVKEHFDVIENDEWLTAMLDAEGHILFGVKRDTGKPYFPLNEMYHVEQSPEFFALWKDEEDHILMGIRRDGLIVGEIHAVNALKQTIAEIQSYIESLQSDVKSITDKTSTIEGNFSTLTEKVNDVESKVSTMDASLKELLDVISLQENPEFLAVETDADGRMLASTNIDGSHYAYNMKSETIDAKVDKEEGKSLIDENVANAQSVIDDVEDRMSMETDADGKIMAYRDKDGVKHEHEEEVKTLHVSNLDLKDNSVNDIQSALIANGFTVKMPVDWSESSYIQIPIPRIAKVNIISEGYKLEQITAKSGLGTSGKDCDIPVIMEFSDGQGNYFKKHILLSAQGNSSLIYEMKNLACDISDGSEIRFGNWVSQDSFHWKKYYPDVFRGQSIIAYKIMEDFYNTRPIGERRPWDFLNSSTATVGEKEVSLSLNTNAMAHSDGFPMELYWNNEFKGLYVFQLKKHRSNYNMDKNDSQKIILDGVIGSTFWGGTVNWTDFEIKNPKKLFYSKIAADGTTELSEKTMKYIKKATFSKKDIKENENGDKYYPYNGDYADILTSDTFPDNGVTAKVKARIEELSLAKKAITGKEDLSSRFNLPFFIDYFIVSQLLYNWDGWTKNWIWCIYNDKATPTIWDCDNVFGCGFNNTSFIAPTSEQDKYWKDTIVDELVSYCSEDIKSRYQELRELNVISVNNIMDKFEDWCSRIGYDNYKKEIDLFHKLGYDIPSYRDKTRFAENEYWKVVQTSDDKNVNLYSGSVTYNIGDKAKWEDSYRGFFIVAECIKNVIGHSPKDLAYMTYPQVGGSYNNIKRTELWLKERIAFLDNKYSLTI